MEDIYEILFFSTSFIFLYGLVSRYLRNKLFLSEPLVSVGVGIILGHHVLGIFDTNYVYSKFLMYNFARIVLCIQTMAVAMSLPKNYIIDKWQSMFVLVLVIGLLKCLFSYVLIYMFSNYNSIISWSVAACLTPTDPILSSSIIQGEFAVKMVPERIRQLLAAESGINDGLGILLLFFGMNLFKKGATDGLYSFIVEDLIVKVVLSAVCGLVTGVLSRLCLKFCYSKRLVSVESFVVHGIVLSFFSLELMELIGGSELICIFFSGIMFSFDEWFVLETRSSKLQEITDATISSALFMFFGSRIDFSRFTTHMVLVSLLIIFVRRPLVCKIMYRYIPDLKNEQEAIFVGWFGPIGVGALYYSLLTDKIQETLTIDFVSCTVFLSILIHGLTVPMYNLILRIFYCNCDQNRNETII